MLTTICDPTFEYLFLQTNCRRRRGVSPFLQFAEKYEKKNTFLNCSSLSEGTKCHHGQWVRCSWLQINGLFLFLYCLLFIVYCLLSIVTLNNKPWAVGAAFLAANVLHSSYRIYVNDPHNKDILWNY